MWGIMATNEKDQTNAVQPNVTPVAPVASPVTDVKPTDKNTQSYWLPDYKMSVKAESLEEAIAIAEQSKGVK